MEQFFFSSLLLCTTTRRIWILRQLHNGSFQSIKLNEIPRTKLIRVKRKQTETMFAKADSLEDKDWSCPRFKLWTSQALILDGAETGVLLSDFVEQLSRKGADVPNIYFALLDNACKFPAPVLTQNAKHQRERQLGFFQNMNVRSCKDSTRRAVLRTGLCAIYES